MIHICMALHDESGKYSKFTTTAIASVCMNTNRKVCFCVFHDNTVLEKQKNLIRAVVENYKQKVIFTKASVKEEWYTFHKITKAYSVATMFRLLIPELMPDEMDKVIFLDSDVVVDMDIGELWDYNVDNFPVMGRKDKWCDNPLFSEGVDSGTYINAGIMLMNLRLIRSEPNLSGRISEFIQSHPNSLFVDQDVINYIFNGRQGLLPERFNMLTVEHRNKEYVPEEKCIYHFAGDCPRLNGAEYFDRLFFGHLATTPFGKIIEDNTVFYTCINEMQKKISQSIELLKRLYAAKTIVFWGAIDSIGYRELRRQFDLTGKNVFFVDTKKELYGSCVDGYEIRRPENLLKCDKVYVIVLAYRYYQEISEELKRYGLQENEDFGSILSLFVPEYFYKGVLARI